MTVLSSDGWSFGCPDRVFDSTGHDAVSLGAVTALDPNVNADARRAQRNQAAVPSLCADCSSSNGGCPPLRTARTAPAAATDTARRSVLKRIAKALDVDVTELLK